MNTWGAALRGASVYGCALLVACASTAALFLLGCGTSVRSTPSPPVAAEPARPRALPDLSSCALSARVLEIGGGAEVSAPVEVSDGFVVAFERHDGGRGEPDLFAQHVRVDGTLEPPVLVRAGARNPWGIVFGDAQHAYVVAGARGAPFQVLAIQSSGGEPDGVLSLDGPPDGAARGPRGIVTTHSADGHRVVRWGSGREVELPAQTSWPTPPERILVAGSEIEALVARHATGASFVALGSGPPRSTPLFTESEEPESQTTTASGVSVAAGPEGFVVVRSGPGYLDLEARFADRHGSLAPSAVPIPVPSSATSVRRYPQATALGTGWVVSYWDGRGASLVRIDARGAVTGDALELRSGDERGGHTDAPMVVGHGVIVATWYVAAPMFGVAPDEPTRPHGARIAILRCADHPEHRTDS